MASRFRCWPCLFGAALLGCRTPTSAIPPPPDSLLDGSFFSNGDWKSQEPDNLNTRAVGNPIPLVGDQKLLIIPVDFPDREGLFTGMETYNAFFGDDAFSAYYREVSYDQLRYTGSVVGIHNGEVVENSDEIACYVRLPHDITYYANGNHGFTVGGFPQNHMGVVAHAAQALDEAGFDFGEYADENKKVQNVVVVFAGIARIYTGDSVNSLEATAYRVSIGKGSPFKSKDDYEIDNFTFCPDQNRSEDGGLVSGEIAYPGICVHEHGHALSMPDLYDYTYKTTGAGEFDLMAYGTYGGDESGRKPFHYGAFSKVFFGWATPSVYGEGSHEVTLAPAVTHPDIIKLYPGGDESATEYFLLENRQLLGFDEEWDSFTNLCPGLLIWHVDNDQVQDFQRFLRINSSAFSDPENPGIRVIEQDGRDDLISSPLNFGQCEDLWQVGDTWKGDTLWDGSDTNLRVRVVRSESLNLVLQIDVGETATTGNEDENCNFFCQIATFFESIFNLLFGWLF